MFSSAELIEALHRRTRRSLRPPPPPGEFPPGWRDWFAAVAARPGRVTGASAEDILAMAALRAPAMPEWSPDEHSRWRAFSLLWRQQWQPESSDERWTRVASMSGSLLLHLLFVVAIAWLMFFRPPFQASAVDARDGEEHVLQVEYIGDGTPVDAGGGAAEAQVELPDAVEPAPLPPQPEPEPLADVLPTPPPAPEVVPEVPQLAMPVVQVAVQELQVTEVDVADTRFQVPPPREVVVEAPEVRRPAELAARQREVDLDVPAPVQAPAPQTRRELELAAPELARRGVEVAERRVELAEIREVTVDSARVSGRITAPESSASAPAVRERGVPMPAARPPAPAPTAAGAAPGGASSAGTVAGSGRMPGQPPGALPSSRASDDWGDSSRNVPGREAGTPGASGLFNADGSPRLADGGAVGGGLPPGTITEEFENIDRHGTWLKRPPYDYEPTAFDRFWMPTENLLEEWVRKSVTEVRIPIPGTTKTIRCVTVMLALGGACDIVDPNLQEQPASARKPPDVPFKRELQEDQGSLGPSPEPLPER